MFTVHELRNSYVAVYVTATVTRYFPYLKYDFVLYVSRDIITTTNTYAKCCFIFIFVIFYRMLACQNRAVKIGYSCHYFHTRHQAQGKHTWLFQGLGSMKTGSGYRGGTNNL